jgi:DNA-directed RNA polymerase alpha subunit
MDRKSPDVALMANDILYIPGKRISTKVLETSLGMSVGAANLRIQSSTNLSSFMEKQLDELKAKMG